MFGRVVAVFAVMTDDDGFLMFMGSLLAAGWLSDELLKCLQAFTAVDYWASAWHGVVFILAARLMLLFSIRFLKRANEMAVAS